MTQAHVVLGLGFGDEGKGALVDWLVRALVRENPTRPPPLVVRWNGGPQAAHHVYTDDGRRHCFAQLGSGSFVPGVGTHLTDQMLVDPYALWREAEALSEVGVPDALSRVTVDPAAVLVTPWHAITNRVRELLRGAEAHGTTGRGIAEARLQSEQPGVPSLRAASLGADLSRAAQAVRDEQRRRVHSAVGANTTPELARWIARLDAPDLMDAFLSAATEVCARGVRVERPRALPPHLVLEGAQGALLDRTHGFFPHVSPSAMTRHEAQRALDALGTVTETAVWGVLRAYHTRHGAGPLPTEDPQLRALLPEPDNGDAGPQGAFRVGWFDATLARYALEFAGPIDHLCLTCVDRVEALPERWISPRWTVSPAPRSTAPSAARTRDAFRALPNRIPVPPGEDLVSALETAVGRPFALTSHGPTASARRVRAGGLA